MLGWVNHKVEISIISQGGNINNLRYADDSTLMAKSERRTEKPLDESERGE